MEMLKWLPEEIQVDIFLRLPVKSIQRCRCVCKRWCKLLYNPKFIKEYHLLNQNNKNPRLMFISHVVGAVYPICRSIDNASISLSSTPCDGAILMNNNFFQGHWDCYRSSCLDVAGSCNGLICICMPDPDSPGIYSKFCIWNPATGTSKVYSNCFRWSYESTVTVGYGFGHDSHLDDYKLVKIVQVWGLGGIEGFGFDHVEVYTLGSNSCKTVQCMKQYMVIAPNHLSVSLLNGALHWPAYIQETDSRVIVSFVISTERFVDFVYPEQLMRRNRMNKVNKVYDNVGILEDRLCLLVYTVHWADSPVIDVWLMQDYGVRESWVKQFSFQRPFKDIHTDFFKLVWSSTNGEVLIDTGYNKILVDKNDSTKCLELQIRGFDNMVWSRPVSYVESLVSLTSVPPSFYNLVAEKNKRKRERGSSSIEIIDLENPKGSESSINPTTTDEDEKHVRGMGGGVTKTQMLASATPREILIKVQQEIKSMQSGIELLKSQYGTLLQKCASSSSFQAPDESTMPASSCFIKNFRGRTVALGSYNTTAPRMEHAYSVIVEEIFDKDAELYDEEGKLGDVMIGQVINWPKPSVKPFWQ